MRRIAKHVWENQLSNVQFDPAAFKQVGVKAGPIASALYFINSLPAKYESITTLISN